MKIWRCGAMLASFFFSGICFAQVPTTPIPASTPSDISVSFIFAAKDQTPSHYGLGGQFSASHFVNDKIGYQVEGDYLKMDIYNLRDIGIRIGPIVRVRSGHAVQPYMHALLGYAKVKSLYLEPTTSFNGAPSILAGGGFEFPFSGGWYGRVEADFEADWTARMTTNGRGIMGVSYRFGVK